MTITWFICMPYCTNGQPESNTSWHLKIIHNPHAISLFSNVDLAVKLSPLNISKTTYLLWQLFQLYENFQKSFDHGLLICTAPTINFTTQVIKNSFSLYNAHSKVPVDGFVPNVADTEPQSRDPKFTAYYHRRNHRLNLKEAPSPTDDYSTPTCPYSCTSRARLRL